MRIVSVDIGCQPSPSGSGELILQSEKSALIIFIAIDTKLSERGYLEDKGVAKVRCIGCCQTRHGYPNDDGRQEHPLWSDGLSEVDGVAEVKDSRWVTEVRKQTELTARRLWGDRVRGATDLVVEHDGELRHFIFKFKESTFECLASGLSVSLHEEPYEKVVSQALAQVLRESAT